MSHLLTQILQSGKVKDASGKLYDLHSHTSTEQCVFLTNLVNEIDAERCLEVGLAYGISSLAICGAISKKADPLLLSIDPQQHWWKDIGLKNLADAGYGRFVRFFRERSDEVLPRLAAEGTVLDFAYVDTTKIFDQVLVDSYYILKMLRIGGLLVLDDCSCPGVDRVARCISRMPHLELHAMFGAVRKSAPKRLVSRALNLLPKRRVLFSDRILNPDLAAQCIAFRKTGGDERRWDWYPDF
jgi:predicted O-methyltransferase YrrM